MIIREEKRIVNGFGTIGIFSSQNNNIIIKHIKPPKEIGSSFYVDEVIEVDTIKFENLSYKEIAEMISALENVKGACLIEYFNEWTLDFTEFNQASVNMHIQKLKDCLHFWQFALAC